MAKATLTFGMDLSEFNTAFNKINRQTNNLSQSLGRGIGDAMNAYKKGLKELKLSTSLVDKEKIKSDLDSLKNKIKTSTKAKLDLDISEAKNKLKGLVGNILATIGAVKGMTAPISAAIGFEESMADVRKVVDFDNKEELTSFGNEIKKLSREIPMSMNELAAITASGGQLGIAKKDLLEFTQVAAKMGVAFDISANEAGDSMGKLMNIFNTDIKGVTKLGDAINHLSDNSASKAAEVVEVLKRIGGTSQTVGITAEQAAALSAAFLSLGKTPELAATSSRTLLLQLKNIGTASPKAKEALESIGMSASDLEKAMSKNPQEAILSFLQAVKTMPNQDKQLEVLTDIFGRGFSSDIALLVNGLDTYKNTLKNVANETDYLGSMTKEFKNKSDTTANNLQLLKNSFYEIGVNIGSVFLPFLNKVIDQVKKITSKIADFAMKFPTLTKVIGLAVAGMVALNISFLSFKVAGSVATIGISSFSGLLLKLPAVLSSARVGIMAFSSVLKAVNLAFATNPIGAILIAIAVAGLLVYRYWDELKAFFSGFFTGLKAGLEPTITAFKNGFGGIFGALKSAKDALVSFFSLFSRGKKAKDELNGIKEAGVDFGVGFGKSLSLILYPLEALSNIFNALGLAFDIFMLKGANCAEDFMSGVKGIYKDIKTFFQPLFDFFATWFNKPLRGFANSIKNMCKDIKAFFQPLFDFIMTGFDKALSILLYPLEALSNIFNAIGLIVDIIALKGANFTEGFTNSIKNMCEDIKAFFKPLFDFIMAGFDRLSNIFDPLITTIDIISLKGANFTEGFANGVNGMCENIKAFFQPLFDFIMAGFDSITSVYNSIVNMPSNLVSGAKGLWSGTKDFFGFGSDEQNTKGAIKEVVASNQNYMDNKSTRQITDNKVINISMQGSNATPESVATAIRNNSYAFGGD